MGLMLDTAGSLLFKPSALLNKQSTMTVQPDPTSAKPGDPIGFIETFEDF
jgi:hypothetical protein